MEQPKDPQQGGFQPSFAHHEIWSVPGFEWRVAVSIIVAIGWLCFLIMWLFFYAGDYSIFQNLAVVIISILMSIGVLAAMWAPWGIRMARSVEGAGFAQPAKMSRPILITMISIASGIGWLIFLVVWLFFHADDYSGYQNLAVFILSLLVVGILNGGSWALWGLVKKSRI